MDQKVQATKNLLFYHFVTYHSLKYTCKALHIRFVFHKDPAFPEMMVKIMVSTIQCWMKIWTDYTGSSKTFDWLRTLTRCKFSCLSFLWSHLTNNRVYKYIFKSSIQDQMHLCFDRVKRPSSGWMAVTRITHHYYMITNKFENLNALQRKINTRALLPGARPLILKPCGWIQSNI